MDSTYCSSDPDNDFRSISLLPRRCDLLQHGDSFLRPNIINGGYSSVDHYLDIQFRLLREDFLRGLREGIQSYLNNKWQGSYENIRIFNNVKFLKLLGDLDKTGYLVQLQLKEIKNMKSDKDMFMFGSLLVFTCDNFRNVLISTVLNSDKHLLDRGQILVAIPADHFSDCTIHDFYMKNYTMIESEVYFEPYYHVLKALQHEDLARNFPMKKYIIDAKDHTAWPSYIGPYSSSHHNFTKGTVELNESQRDAYKMALSREFAVIQGPPGTGKTHLGLKVAKAVLENGHRVKPMLVICFTNHALDQFLEGLLKITDKIVRIGGRSKSEKLEAYNLSKLRKDNRTKMLPSTYREIVQPLKSTVQIMVKIEVLYRRQLQKYKQYQMQKDRILLNNATVIGMTTTGAARLQPLLRSLQAPVVIVEEAAEVLEAHIIASLTEHCKHLILIGDHKQLQPSSASYMLGQKYNLEISLFERMITNGIHSTTLNVQHRMRPAIAALIAPAIYEDLKNHPTVACFPRVKGLKKNVYFVNHKVHEDSNQNNDTSRSNRYEAQFLIRLAIYLLQQGYEAEEITILATYKGQTLLLKDVASHHEDLKDVLIKTVDNYQGEENKIILLSLVRCNKSESIGFLARENRVCVALSRAREGFYLIGNMDGLRNKSKLWMKIGISLKQQDAVSPALPLMCHYHPNIVTMVSKGEDFDKIRDGRCHQRCVVAMNCGHPCNMRCHEFNRQHTDIKCLEPCERNICDLQHSCPKRCYEKCYACIVIVTKRLLCGHNARVPCGSPVSEVICKQPCMRSNAQCKVKNVKDKHICPKMCFQACDPCPVIVRKQSTNCPHIFTLKCYQEPLGTLCIEECTRSLSCGHPCTQDCRKECDATLCKVMVGTRFLLPCNVKQRGLFSTRFLSYTFNKLFTNRCL